MGRYPKTDSSSAVSTEPNSPTSPTASTSPATLSGYSESDDWKYSVPESQHDSCRHGELVVGTEPLCSYTCVTGTHTKEITRPISEDQGYGTHKVTTAIQSGLLGSCEPNPNPDEEESEGDDDRSRPINITDELQNKDKMETGTAKSTQQPMSWLSDPATSQYTTGDELTPPPDKPAHTLSTTSSAEHRLKLLDTGQPPGRDYISTSEDVWCSKCSPSESPHQPDLFVGAPIISAIMPPCYLWDSESPFTCIQEDYYKISDVRPFYSMAGPEVAEEIKIKVCYPC